MTGVKKGRTRVRETIAITRTLDRGLALLELLSIEREATLSHLARGVGVTPTTASRLLETLKARGLVDYDDETALFSVGMKAFLIGSSVIRARRLDRVALPAMRALAEDTGLAVNLGVRDGGSAVYVEQVEAGGAVRLSQQLGRHMPLHATAIGKVLIAWLWSEALERAMGDSPFARLTDHTTTERQDLWRDLELVRAQGFATDDQEYEDGLFCIAAPIRDRSGDVVAGLSLSSVASRMSPAIIRVSAMQLTDAAAVVASKLGWTGPASSQATSHGHEFAD